jgi:GNAT superfamily N-acetyltransferase
VIAVRRATPDDVPAWRSLAREVEGVLGAPMADDLQWLAGLDRAIDEGRAWTAVDVDGAFAGAMTLATTDPEVVAIAWLAVPEARRRRGAGRALVQHALLVAAPRPVRVVTFREGPAPALCAACGFVGTDDDAGHPDRVVYRRAWTGRATPSKVQPWVLGSRLP